MPLVSRPVSVDGHVLLDGGISDPVPYRYMEKIGYNHNVIILTQPKGYIKKKSSALPIIKLVLRNYPSIVEAMSVRHKRYNRQMKEIEKREQDGTSFVIRPPKSLGIKRTENDPDELERVYRIGREEAEVKLPKLKEFLKIS